HKFGRASKWACGVQMTPMVEMPSGGNNFTSMLKRQILLSNQIQSITNWDLFFYYTLFTKISLRYAKSTNF
ncbi:hypothetical protein, partial [Ornithobacterium rhinotracheale]